MRLFRNRRWLAARNVVVALVVYAVAATGLLGAALHAATVAEAGESGFVTICTSDGLAFAQEDGGPGKVHPPAVCLLCNAAEAVATPAPEGEGAAVAPPVVISVGARDHAPLLPAYAFDGWLGTRSPRAPPASAA